MTPDAELMGVRASRGWLSRTRKQHWSAISPSHLERAASLNLLALQRHSARPVPALSRDGRLVARDRGLTSASVVEGFYECTEEVSQHPLDLEHVRV